METTLHTLTVRGFKVKSAYRGMNYKLIYGSYPLISAEVDITLVRKSSDFVDRFIDPLILIVLVASLMPCLPVEQVGPRNQICVIAMLVGVSFTNTAASLTPSTDGHTTFDELTKSAVFVPFGVILTNIFLFVLFKNERTETAQSINYIFRALFPWLVVCYFFRSTSINGLLNGLAYRWPLMVLVCLSTLSLLYTLARLLMEYLRAASLGAGPTDEPASECNEESQRQQSGSAVVTAVESMHENDDGLTPDDEDDCLLSDQMFRDFFSRYDLDGSGTINTAEELQQLSVNLVFALTKAGKLREGNTVGRDSISHTLQCKVEEVASPFEWTDEEFKLWFKQAVADALKTGSNT